MRLCRCGLLDAVATSAGAPEITPRHLSPDRPERLECKQSVAPDSCAKDARNSEIQRFSDLESPEPLARLSSYAAALSPERSLCSLRQTEIIEPSLFEANDNKMRYQSNRRK